MSTPTRKRVKLDETRPAHNKACARCRKRKIKCDSVWPSCSSCKSAHVQCVGYDTTLSTEVPRSVATYLEEKVNTLERKIREAKEQHENQITSILSSNIVPLPNLRLRHMLSGALTSVVELEDSNSFNISQYYGSFHLQQSSLPLPFPPQTPYPSRDEAGGKILPTAMSLSDIPRKAADLMFKNYTENLLRRHACVEEREIIASYTKCFDDQQRASSWDVFVVSMALAISAATLIWRDEKHALAASAGLFAKAKEMLALPTLCETEFQQIQISLLLTHYSFMNPSAADSWYCIGDASRHCINLGLHKEADPDMGLSPNQIDTRRRLFWTTCGLERSICSQLRLPFFLDESTVTTKPYSPHSEGRIFPWRDSKCHKPYDDPMVEFHFLETEAYNMLWSLHDHHMSIPIEEWQDSFNARVEEWHTYAREKELTNEPDRLFDMSTLGLNLIKSRLYRPTPRIMYPPLKSRVEFIKAAMGVANHYTRYCQNHRLIYPWFAGHNLFETAIVTLDTAWLGSDWLSQHVDLQEVINCITDFGKLLHEVAQFWPAIKACADTFVVLAKPVTHRLEAINRYEEPPWRDDTTSNILALYLFPDSALAAEQRTVSDELNEFQSLPVDDMLINGFENFDWNTGALDQTLFSLDFI